MDKYFLCWVDKQLAEQSVLYQLICRPPVCSFFFISEIAECVLQSQVCFVSIRELCGAITGHYICVRHILYAIRDSTGTRCIAWGCNTTLICVDSFMIISYPIIII